MRLTQSILSAKQSYFIGIQVALMLLMLGDQNTVELITVLVQNNCQVVSSDRCLDKDDRRLRDCL